MGVNSGINLQTGINNNTFIGSLIGTTGTTGIYPSTFLYIAGGSVFSNSNPSLAYSTNGTGWNHYHNLNYFLMVIVMQLQMQMNLWVAGGYGLNQLTYSTNGTGWTLSSVIGNVFSNSQCTCITYGNGLWVAGGNGTNQLAYSTDGTGWTSAAVGNVFSNNQCLSVVYGNGLWVAGGNGTNQFAYSTDGNKLVIFCSRKCIFCQLLFFCIL